MRTNLVKEKLKAGEATVGMWLTLGSPLVAEHMAHIGFDWLVVDMEHGPADLPIAMNCFQAISTTDTVPLARVASNDATRIKRILDIGAMGIVVPMVNSAEDARRAVEAMKFPPEGIRSMAMGRGGMAYGDDYMDAANEEILVIVQIEHHQGVANVEDIVATPGVDVCFIGPYDLAATMGVQRGSDEHEEAIQAVLAAAHSAGVSTGMYCDNAEIVIQRMSQGVRFLANADDTRCVQKTAADEYASIAYAAGGE